MNQLCQKIKQNLCCLPPKDEELCNQFFTNRNFEGIMEIVKSCLIMKRMDMHKETHKKKWENVDINKLEELVFYVEEYATYLDISEFYKEI